MEKMLLTFILLAVIVTGILHNDYAKIEKMETILSEQIYMNSTPDISIDPFVDPMPY